MAHGRRCGVRRSMHRMLPQLLTQGTDHCTGAAALPKLQQSGFDFAPIDGRHGLPAPFMDWFDIAERLRRGGIVLVDDTWIWTCNVLVRCLDTNPGWRRCAALSISAAFRNERDDAQYAEWVDQPLVYWQSPAARFIPETRP
jgi:hypothetical protein